MSHSCALGINVVQVEISRETRRTVADAQVAQRR